MNRKARLRLIIQRFEQKMPEPVTELHYKNEYELTVAVILSAQCTDKRVNLITPKLFEHYPDFFSMSKAEPADVYEFIKSCSYPNNKAKHLVGLARCIVNDYKGILPRDVKLLTALPGIGRKTAHVLMSVLEKQKVLAVDTHVFRVAHRLGIVNSKAKTPLTVEKQIVEIVDNKDVLVHLHHWLILHGRYVCIARKPLCHQCFLFDICIDFQKRNKKILNQD